MTPGFWLIVGMAAICLAAGLVWLGDRIADAIDVLAERYADELEEDAATYGEPTREEVEGPWFDPDTRAWLDDPDYERHTQ